MSLPLYQVDAFTNRPFAGNPAAVVVLDREAEAGWMQQVAQEMNLAETAFVCRADSRDHFHLRWFSPKVEVELCGHATLATAKVLWETGRLATDQSATFHTRSGPLIARLTSADSADDAWIEMDFPAHPAEPIDAAAAREIGFDAPAMLGLQAVRIGRSKHDLLAEVADADTVRQVRPALDAIAPLPVRGIIVTAPGDEPNVDFVSRFFAPGMGIPEDAVTGSAHCVLGPWWAARLGRESILGRQLSRRGGTVHTRIDRDRVALGGQAVVVMEGRLRA